VVEVDPIAPTAGTPASVASETSSLEVEALDPIGDARACLQTLESAGVSAEILQCVREALASPSVFFPLLPEAAIQATQVVDSPRCDVLDLADTLNADPSIAARVVEIANLSFFAGAEPVYTARDAVVRMGIRETRNVVMGVAIRSLICDGPGYTRERSELWEHSLATAACAQGLLCELAYADCMGFLAGLAHEIGRSALYSWLGQRGMLEVAEPELAPISDAIHAPIGAAMLLHWRLRYELIEAVLWYPAEGSGRSSNSSPVAAALSVASQMAHALLDRESATELERALAEKLSRLGISEHRAHQLQNENRARLDELLKIL